MADNSSAVNLVVAADNTVPVAWRDSADYVCGITGNDEFVIKQALDDLAPAGGRVVMLTGTYSIDGALPVGTHTYNEEFEFLPGAVLQMNDGATFTVDQPGSMVAGEFQIFSGTDVSGVSINNQKAVLPEWFGAVGDGTTNQRLKTR